MIHIRPRDLTATGWLLAVLATGLGVLVSVAITMWAHAAIDRAVLGEWRLLLTLPLALPGIGIAMFVFRCGGRRLERSGFVVLRRGRLRPVRRDREPVGEALATTEGAPLCREVQGIEWDWFASDASGCVALFSSGGSGQVPPVMLAMEAQIGELLELANIRCDAQSWRAAAQFGFYAYDVDANGGPFQRLAIPASPKKVDDIPERFRALLRTAVVTGSFASMAEVTFANVRT